MSTHIIRIFFRSALYLLPFGCPGRVFVLVVVPVVVRGLVLKLVLRQFSNEHREKEVVDKMLLSGKSFPLNFF